MSAEIPEGFINRRGDRNPVPWHKGAILLTKAGKQEVQAPRDSDCYDADVECRWFIADDKDDIVAYQILDLSEADKLVAKFHEYLLFVEEWDHNPISQNAFMKIAMQRKLGELNLSVESYLRSWPNDPKLKRKPRVNYWLIDDNE